MNLHGILNKGQGRRRVERQVAMLAAIGVVMLGGIAVASTAQATGEKITICHRTGSGDGGNAGNGYDYLNGANGVSIDSIIRANGHDSHDKIGNGPGGDIIPAFGYTDEDGRTHQYDGKNLDWGQAWLDNGCIKPVEPVVALMNLTYMTDCAPDTTNTWRIRNSSDFPVDWTLFYAGNPVAVASGTAAPGDSFVNLPRETATAILKWGGGDSNIIAGQKTKASGIDEKSQSTNPNGACYVPPPPPRITTIIPDVPGISLVKSYTLLTSEIPG